MSKEINLIILFPLFLKVCDALNGLSRGGKVKKKIKLQLDNILLLFLYYNYSQLS